MDGEVDVRAAGGYCPFCLGMGCSWQSQWVAYDNGGQVWGWDEHEVQVDCPDCDGTGEVTCSG